MFLTVGLFSFFFLFQQTSYAQSVRIEASELLVRSGPGTTYEPIGHVDEGQLYSFIEEEDGWLAIDFNGETGWVSEDFVTLYDHANEEVESDDQLINEDAFVKVEGRFKIPVDRINIRESATTQSDILKILRKGEWVTIIGKIETDWVEIESADISGFIPSWLVEDKQQSTNTTDAILKDKVILIDPGHGGYDVGAISITGNYESIYTLNTALVLKGQLEDLGADVYMTRDQDLFIPLSARGLLANYLSADVFLSLHYNSEPQIPSANGMNTYYRSGKYSDLATSVHQGLIQQSAANDRGIESGNYQVLRLSRRPGLLIELGFISNANEEPSIQSIEYLEELSRGIVNGLEDYFTNQ